MALIDYPNQWDAVQLLEVRLSQVWDETLAVVCPTLDSRYDVIPHEYVDAVFNSPSYVMIQRVQSRILESYYN